jgi:integrase
LESATACCSAGFDIPADLRYRAADREAQPRPGPRRRLAKTCICGEKHSLVFTTRTGHPIEPRNINRAFDVRCARYRVRRITLHDTRRTCGSLLAALDVHPRIAMAILRHSRISLTMEIYTQVPDKVTRDALRRLSEWLDHDEDQGEGDN